MLAKESPNILWIGSIFNDSLVFTQAAVSPAANKWQKGLVHAIANTGASINILGHQPEPLWPKGKWHLKENNTIQEHNIQSDIVSYFNLPGIRNTSLKYQYLRKFNSLISATPNIHCLISYNILPASSFLGQYAQRKFGIPWICLIADAPGEEPAKSKHQKLEDAAYAKIFLSWASYQQCASPLKFHLDGGVTDFATTNPAPPEDSTQYILYSGTLSKFGGVTELVDAFQYVRHNNVKLLICGKGQNEEARLAAQKDKRIQLLGFITPLELKARMDQATIFINPRPPLPDNSNNFPSKLFDYFSYCKPIISTWTPGLNPIYKDILNVVETFQLEDMARKIDEVLDWDSQQYADHSQKTHQFVQNNCLWDSQAKRLCSWLKQNV